MNVAVENEIYEESAVEVTDDAIDVTVDRVEDQVDVEETDIPEDAAGNEPVCGAHPDCHAWKGGRCMALTDTDFGTRDCPFYKNKDQNEWEQQDALERLIDQGRLDLIEKYKTPLVKLGILPDTDGIVRGSSDLEDPYIDQIAAELEQYSEQYVQELLETGETGASRKSGNDCSDKEEGWDD